MYLIMLNEILCLYCEAMAEMRDAMDELHRHNLTLEDDVYNIRQHQHESNPPRGDGTIGPLSTLR